MENLVFTDQLNEVIDAWLKWSGYKDLEDYGRKEIAPYDGETGQSVLSGDCGYAEEYICENIVGRYLSKFTMTKESFLNFYFNTGADGDQHQMRTDLGYKIIEELFKGNYTYTFNIQEVFENCGYIRMWYCKEVTEGHPLEDYENIDLDWDIDIQLVD